MSATPDTVVPIHLPKECTMTKDAPVLLMPVIENPLHIGAYRDLHVTRGYLPFPPAASPLLWPSPPEGHYYTGR